jgi:1,4-alpha-glucan branching enzyme
MKKKKVTEGKTVAAKEKEKKETPSKEEQPVGLKKQYLKSRPICKITFLLPKAAAPDAKAITVVGDFNNWDKGSSKMKRQKNGNFTATLELEKGRDYRFRYLVDGNRWENDWNADSYMPNDFGGDDSIVSV